MYIMYKACHVLLTSSIKLKHQYKRYTHADVLLYTHPSAAGLSHYKEYTLYEGRNRFCQNTVVDSRMLVPTMIVY